MTMLGLVAVVEWFFLSYFIALNVGYLSLNLIALLALPAYMERRSLERLPTAFLGFEPPVSVLVPAYNEEAVIEASVRSLLQLGYPEFEVVVVSDGSTDATLDVLTRAFDLVHHPEAYQPRIGTAPVRAFHVSRTHPNLRVIDKENGGKADALNVGINAARFPLFCVLDADSILQRDSLLRIVQPFLEDPTTVAVGGTVRVANGCRVSDGFLREAGLPSNPLALFQVVEYLRAFLFGRMGWSPLNAILIISGAFGLFHKETVVEVGGYCGDTIGEDMELVVRLHRFLRQERRKYRITFIPDPVAWSECPEDLATLRNQRIRWQRGLAESLSRNLSLCFGARGGAAGWIAFPFMVVFEWFGPLIEIVGYLFMTIGAWAGFVSGTAFFAFFAVAIGFGTLLSVTALLLEEVSFRLYPRVSQVALLFCVVVLENFGYRQLNSWWRVRGFFRWLFSGKANWGAMKRTATWSRG